MDACRCAGHSCSRACDLWVLPSFRVADCGWSTMQSSLRSEAACLSWRMGQPADVTCTGSQHELSQMHEADAPGSFSLSVSFCDIPYPTCGRPAWLEPHEVDQVPQELPIVPACSSSRGPIKQHQHDGQQEHQSLRIS